MSTLQRKYYFDSEVLTSHIEFHLPVPNAETTKLPIEHGLYVHVCGSADIHLHAHGPYNTKQICVDRDVHIYLFDGKVRSSFSSRYIVLFCATVSDQVTYAI